MKSLLLNRLIGSMVVLGAAHAAAEPANVAGIEAANRNVALHVARSMLGNGDLQEVGRHIAPHLIAHDPAMASGRSGMLAAIDTLRRSLRGYTLTVKHALADRDLVLVHSHLSATPANEKSGLNRIDIYRLDKGMVVEHWSLGGAAAQSSASGNSAFSDLYQYAGTPPVLSRERVELNRLLVTNLSEEVFGKQNFALLERFWAPGYIQHNPYVGNGRAALAGVIEYISMPGKSYRVTHSLGGRDLTAVCAHTSDPGRNPDNQFEGVMVCDLYRVVNYELVEHWDVYQAIPASSVSGNAMVSSLYGANQRQGTPGRP